jgi:hypothetical protein
MICSLKKLLKKPHWRFTQSQVDSLFHIHESTIFHLMRPKNNPLFGCRDSKAHFFPSFTWQNNQQIHIIMFLSPKNIFFAFIIMSFVRINLCDVLLFNWCWIGKQNSSRDHQPWATNFSAVFAASSVYTRQITVFKRVGISILDSYVCRFFKLFLMFFFKEEKNVQNLSSNISNDS